MYLAWPTDRLGRAADRWARPVQPHPSDDQGRRRRGRRIPGQSCGNQVRSMAMRRALTAFAACATLALSACADPSDTQTDAETPAGTDETESFPEHEIRVIVPSSAGGGLDTTARQLQPAWEEQLGQSVVVENHPDGNFAVGPTTMLNIEADCYAVMLHIPLVFGYSYMTQDVPYTYEDFYPVSGLTTEPSVLRVRDDAPWNTLDEFIDDARGRPGEITTGVGGLTSNQYVAWLQIEEETGTDFNVVPFAGGGEARTALLAGEVDAVVAGVFNSQEIADKTHVLAVLQSENKWPELTNDAPTFNEALGTSLPENAARYVAMTHRECKEDHPERFKILAETLTAAAESPEHIETLTELGLEKQQLVTSAEATDRYTSRVLKEAETFVAENEELQQ
ncbi:MAG: hypothetical protein GEU93_06505 [Propionibacteriales bacterium]|nr:hypothetical protein [Propionibacteriales bacterium]